MQTGDFDYELPVELIAQHPPASRSGGRLLELNADLEKVVHLRVTDLPKQLRAGDLMVMNNTRVYPARLNARKATGGKVELLVENVLDKCTAMCLCKSSKSPKENTEIHLDTGHIATCLLYTSPSPRDS